MKRKLEESGGLTFQIPQFNAEYGMRRVPTVKKIKLQKLDKSLRIKMPKEKKERGLKTKLTAKMVGDSLDLILSQAKSKSEEAEVEEDDDDDEEEEEEEGEGQDPLKNRSKFRPLSSTSSSSSSYTSTRKSSAERVRHHIFLSRLVPISAIIYI